MTILRWLDERLDSVSFRLRLLRMALRRLDNLPAGLVMALETPEYDIDWLNEPDRAMAASEPEAAPDRTGPGPARP